MCAACGHHYGRQWPLGNAVRFTARRRTSCRIAPARRVVERAPELGIRRLTLYAFSSDNGRRPADQLGSIFSLLRAYPRLETERLRQHGAQRDAKG